MSDEAEELDEVSETLTLTQPPVRIDLSELPQSPKSAFLAATACGWQVHAWLSIGEVAPTLYVSSTDKHSAGDVYLDGYTARMFAVEARHPDLPIGFQAHYLGKVYANGRKAGLGSFDYAVVVDPVGVPRVLRAEYKPIKQYRGKFETTKSFTRRVTDAQKIADEMAANYNDNAVEFRHRVMFTVSREFDGWLAEWRSYVPTTTKKATTNV